MFSNPLKDRRKPLSVMKVAVLLVNLWNSKIFCFPKLSKLFEIFLHFHSESKINIISCTSDCEIIISEVWIIKCTKISQTCYNCLKFLSKFRVCDNKINICTSFSEKGSLTSVSRSTLTGGSLETFSKQSKKKKKMAQWLLTISL